MEFVCWQVRRKDKLNEPSVEHHYMARIAFAIREFHYALSGKGKRPKYKDCLVTYDLKKKIESPAEMTEEERQKIIQASKARWSAFLAPIANAMNAMTGKKKKKETPDAGTGKTGSPSHDGREPV
jgi:hypothetical protein